MSDSAHLIVEAFCKLDGQTPGPLFQFIEQYPDFPTQENLAAVEAQAEAAIEAAKAHTCGMQKHRANKVAALALMLRFCVDPGADRFYEAMTSDPPDAVCLEFQRTMRSKMAATSALLEGRNECRPCK